MSSFSDGTRQAAEFEVELRKPSTLPVTPMRLPSSGDEAFLGTDIRCCSCGCRAAGWPQTTGSGVGGAEAHLVSTKAPDASQ